MRKLFNLFAAALVMLVAVSCEKNEVLPDNNSEGKIVTLKASINNGGTKTSLGQGVWEEGDPKVYPVLWSEGDAIAVIQNGVIYKFVLSSVGDSGQTGTFVLDNPSSYQNEFDENGEIKAFYPYDGVSLESGDIKYNVPATQTYVENSFGNGASPMVAYRAAGVEGSLDFQNLFGALKLQLKGNVTVSKIQVFSDKVIKGVGSVIIGETSSLSMPSSNSASDKIVNLAFSEQEGVILSTSVAKSFLITLPNVRHNLTVVITDTDGNIYCKQTKNKTISASNILKMSELNLSEPLNPYVENGVNLGDGVALPAGKDSEGNPTKYLIWAPVNCGYDASNKSGLKYNGATNPCPEGWKVPSKDEVGTLTKAEIYYSEETPVGLKVFGNVSSTTEKSKWIFLPADNVSSTSITSKYWTSTPDLLKYCYLNLNIGYNSTKGSWFYQLSVPRDGQDKTTQSYIRCVKN